MADCDLFRYRIMASYILMSHRSSLVKVATEKMFDIVDRMTPYYHSKDKGHCLSAEHPDQV